MSCGCENQKKARDLDRTRRLAKALAKIEGETVCIYPKDDGTWGFDVRSKILKEYSNKVTEYITQY